MTVLRSSKPAHQTSSRRHCSMYDLVIVSCCNAKLEGTHRAEDLYQSQLYGAARKWALRHGNAWAIASAWHGVISPSMMIESYDHQIKTDKDRHRFAVLADCYLCRWATVKRKRTGRPFSDYRIAILAGKEYVDGILKWSGRRGMQFEAPLEGMQIGERLQYLASEKASPDTLQMSLF